jgi:hypothetical protein
VSTGLGVVSAGAGAAVVVSLAGSLVLAASLLQLVITIAANKVMPAKASFDFLISIAFCLEYNVTEIIHFGKNLFLKPERAK